LYSEVFLQWTMTNGKMRMDPKGWDMMGKSDNEREIWSFVARSRECHEPIRLFAV
jgi:hypothetical protein